MHWFWRAFVAVSIAYLGETGLSIFAATLWPTNWPSWSILWLDDACVILSLLAAIGLYVWLSKRSDMRDILANETRCRKCGHILRGITEPRCPECGTTI